MVKLWMTHWRLHVPKGGLKTALTVVSNNARNSKRCKANENCRESSLKGINSAESNETEKEGESDSGF